MIDKNVNDNLLKRFNEREPVAFGEVYDSLYNGMANFTCCAGKVSYSTFSVKALPTLFFIPAHGAPIVNIGAAPEKYIEIIEELLK